MRTLQGERRGELKCGRKPSTASKAYWVQPRMTLQKGEKFLRWPPILSTAGGGGRPKWGMSDADRGPQMEQKAMPGPAQLTTQLGSPLNHVLNDLLSSWEEDGL
jgi:hypothetical protein